MNISTGIAVIYMQLVDNINFQNKNECIKRLYKEFLYCLKNYSNEIIYDLQKHQNNINIIIKKLIKYRRKTNMIKGGFLRCVDGVDISVEREGDDYYLIFNSCGDMQQHKISKQTYKCLLEDAENWDLEEDEW